MAVNVQELTNEILNDKEFMSRLENAGSAQEVSELLADKGVKISAEQVDEFMLNEIGFGELSEEQMESVAGGKFKWRYLNPLYWLGRLLAAAVTNDMC